MWQCFITLVDVKFNVCNMDGKTVQVQAESVLNLIQFNKILVESKFMFCFVPNLV